MLDRHRVKPPRQWPANTPKPALPMFQLPIFRVHYYDLEAYLARVYRMEGFDFFLATAAHGICPEYTVQAALPPSQDAYDRAHSIRNGQLTKNVSLILNVLCVDGFIPAGRYIIDTREKTDPIDTYKALLRKTLNPLHPDCIQHKNRYRHNREFRRMATQLDQSLDKWLQDEARGQDEAQK